MLEEQIQGVPLGSLERAQSPAHFCLASLVILVLLEDQWSHPQDRALPEASEGSTAGAGPNARSGFWQEGAWHTLYGILRIPGLSWKGIYALCDL